MTAIGTAKVPLVNRCPDPSMESGVSGAQASGNNTTYPLTYDNTNFHSGTRSALLTRASSTLNTTIGVLNATPGTSANTMRLAAAPGEVLSFALYVRCSVNPHQAQIAILWKDSGGTTLRTDTGPLMSGLASGVYNRILYENVPAAPALTAYVTVQVTVSRASGNVVGGELTRFDSLMVNTGPTALAYADGNTAGWAWVGPPNQSASVRWPNGNPVAYNRVPDPSMEGFTSGVPGNTNGTLYGMTFDTTTVHSGTRSVVCTRQAATPNNQMCSIYVTLSTLTNQGVTYVTPGEVISIGLWMRSPVPGWRAQCVPQWRPTDGSSSLGSSPGPILDPLPVNTWVWVTSENLVVPAGAGRVAVLAWSFLPVGQNTVGGEVTFLDSVMVNSGAFALPYADGSSPGWMWSNLPYGSNPIPSGVGPWTEWTGAAEEQLTFAGTWNGSSLVTTPLVDVSAAP